MPYEILRFKISTETAQLWRFWFFFQKLGNTTNYQDLCASESILNEKYYLLDHLEYIRLLDAITANLWTVNCSSTSCSTLNITNSLFYGLMGSTFFFSYPSFNVLYLLPHTLSVAGIVLIPRWKWPLRQWHLFPWS